MKIELVDQRDNRVLYEFDTSTHKVTIFDQPLIDIMKKIGIAVPPKLSQDKHSKFYGKRNIVLEEGDQGVFHKAFRQLYFPSNYDRELYLWKVL